MQLVATAGRLGTVDIADMQVRSIE